MSVSMIRVVMGWRLGSTLIRRQKLFVQLAELELICQCSLIRYSLIISNGLLGMVVSSNWHPLTLYLHPQL